MKKICYVALATFLLMFSGCNTNRNTNYINPNKASKENIKQVVDYLSNNDAEGLKGMFCKKIKSSDKIDLDDQLDQALRFFDGKVDSYEILCTPNIEKVEGGRQKEVSISPRIEVKTTTGQTYEIRFNSYLVYVEDKEKVGISDIDIIQNNGKEINIGNYYIVNPRTSD